MKMTLVVACLIAAVVCSATTLDTLNTALVLLADIKKAWLLAPSNVALLDIDLEQASLIKRLPHIPWDFPDYPQSEDEDDEGLFLALDLLAQIDQLGLLTSTSETTVADLDARYHRLLEFASRQPCFRRQSGDTDGARLEFIVGSALHFEIFKEEGVRNASDVASVLCTPTRFDLRDVWTWVHRSSMEIWYPKQPCAWLRLLPILELRTLEGVKMAYWSPPMRIYVD